MKGYAISHINVCVYKYNYVKCLESCQSKISTFCFPFALRRRKCDNWLLFHSRSCILSLLIHVLVSPLGVMGFRIQKLSMPPWGCGVRESKDRHLARCNSFAWSKEAKYSVTFNNSLGTSPKHFQKSQHMQLTACPAPHDWHDWKCNYRAYSNIRIVYWCYCTELSVQHCLLPDSVRYLTCSLLTGYVLRLVHNILACNAVWLEVHIHWFGHALQHITSKNRTFSILALPIILCVYMHFRLHRTTSQKYCQPGDVI